MRAPNTGPQVHCPLAARVALADIGRDRVHRVGRVDHRGVGLGARRPYPAPSAAHACALRSTGQAHATHARRAARGRFGGTSKPSSRTRARAR